MLTYQTGCELQGEMLGFCFFVFVPPTGWETGYCPHYLQAGRIPPKNIGGTWKRLIKTLESKCLQQQILKYACYSQIGTTLFGCFVIIFKIHIGLLLRWLQGWVRMLHCRFSPFEAFKYVFWIYVEQDNLERQDTVRRNIPTTGNQTSASFTVTLISVFAHPQKSDAAGVVLESV